VPDEVQMLAQLRAQVPAQAVPQAQSVAPVQLLRVWAMAKALVRRARSIQVRLERSAFYRELAEVQMPGQKRWLLVALSLVHRVAHRALVALQFLPRSLAV